MTDPRSEIDAYGVVGNPVSHSLSPKIHKLFAAQSDQPISYEALEIKIDEFASSLARLQQQNYLGLNVTVPFKQQAWQLCNQRTSRAELAGAVNTLLLSPNGGLTGDNTDGIGLVRDLVKNRQVPIKDQKILILGAGGAVRGILAPILAENPNQVIIANRTVEKAQTLADDFGNLGEISVSAYTKIEPIKFDLVINGTAAGLSNELPPIPEEVLSMNTICYDLMYNIQANTTFVDWALKQGVTKAFDGLGMLIEQAAESFRLWRGVNVDTQAVARSLRNA